MWHLLTNSNNEQRDVVLVSVPWVASSTPIAAPAALKNFVESVGLSCLAVDVNLEESSRLANHPLIKEYQDFYFAGEISESIETELFANINLLADKILSWRPKWIGLSLLVADTQHLAQWLAVFLRQKAPDVKIVFGGPGCGVLGDGTGDEFISLMFKHDLIDYHIAGDGEISFVELLKGNVDYPGINGKPWIPLDNEQLENLFFPDYSDYKLEELDNLDLIAINITASRGCVRRCTFCDYVETHKKFQWRNAVNVFNEMVSQLKLYGINKFVFSDSLINGNTKAFNELIRLLADHNQSNPDQKIQWSSFYIMRNIDANDDQLWATMKESGAAQLSIGIEHFSQTVRYEIGKRFTDEAVLHHLRLAQKYKISVLGLFLIGYPTETENDRRIFAKWIEDNKDLNDTIILSLSAMRLIPNTPVFRQKDELGIVLDPTKRTSVQMKTWESSTLDNTAELRRTWVRSLARLAEENGFRTCDDRVTAIIQSRYILEQSLTSKIQ